MNYLNITFNYAERKVVSKKLIAIFVINESVVIVHKERKTNYRQIIDTGVFHNKLTFCCQNVATNTSWFCARSIMLSRTKYARCYRIKFHFRCRKDLRYISKSKVVFCCSKSASNNQIFPFIVMWKNVYITLIVCTIVNYLFFWLINCVVDISQQVKWRDKW